MSNHLDILAIGAHPDDIELTIGGTLIRSVMQGLRVGVLDLTKGELGTRGTVQIRAQEAANASEIIGLSIRENLGLPDGNITSDGLIALIKILRQWRPQIVMTHPNECRHPDHTAAHHLVRNACFYSGLNKIESSDDYLSWRPKHLLYFAEVQLFTPSFVVDVTQEWEDRTKALKCYESQIHSPEYKREKSEPETYISNYSFFEWVEARARTYGQLIGTTYGEPFQYHGTLGVSELDKFLHMEAPFR
ncbi:MAG: bacillithiol biosynthesis deacetylase BshB1 [Bacteroidetes bacterium]|nr:bacillithiol biosynthesis deacetylase BshB1 [Bacteroidota bacterium]MCY4234070.1 bacillithiol biosynthesis deacetylase BshB1 [Bacteroidota bacterium]